MTGISEEENIPVWEKIRISLWIYFLEHSSYDPQCHSRLSLTVMHWFLSDWQTAYLSCTDYHYTVCLNIFTHNKYHVYQLCLFAINNSNICLGYYLVYCKQNCCLLLKLKDDSVMHYANLYSLGKLASIYLSYFAIIVRRDQNPICWQQHTHTERRAEQSIFFKGKAL